MNSESIASVLVGFSTVGFIILFGTATIIPIIYELTVLRKSQSVTLLEYYAYRLITRIGEKWSIVVLMITSLSFAVVGLLSLIYIQFGNQELLTGAMYLSIFVISLLVVYIIIITVSAMIINKDELQRIIEFSTSGIKK
jgi:hypothetical protein